MNRVEQQKHWAGIGCLTLLALAGAAPASGQTADGRGMAVVYNVVEPASGTRLIVNRARSGHARLEVAHPKVRIVRHLTPSTSLTSIEVDSERLSLAFSGRAVVLEGLGPRLEVALGDSAGCAELRRRMAGSRVVTSAIARLAAVHVPPDTPMAGMLASTRFFLRSLQGSEEAVLDLIRVREVVVLHTSVVPVGFTGQDCWDAYVREAVSAWNAFMDCRSSALAWVPGYLQFCDFNYDIQAVSALAAYLGCLMAA